MTDKSLISKTADSAAQWWTDRLMTGDREKFKDFLSDHICKSLEQQGRCYLENDYDPHGALLEAVREAGIECRGNFFSCKGILPQKHETNITPGRIEPKEGYGNWTTPIEVAP